MTAKPASAPPAANAFERAMKASWEMVNPRDTSAAGSYYAGLNSGMIAALQTVRDNYKRELAASAQVREVEAVRPPKPVECANECPPFQVCDHCQWPQGKDEPGPVAQDSRYASAGWALANEAADLIAEQQATITGLEASLAACRADAERYRWLRVNDNADLLAEDVIDEAIDAARSQP